ncbi:MAG: DUF5668 domain-containing protein [Daejeonella sp.]|uniref:LiaI-LiaF-like domain-containing protein n=1 Tax=Daejeonella sp. TaxID=2805397 RepID=UPI002734DB8D|nr:DUF5668 domain-containing protein [Daejeonella sp.]MDP3468768.1 DUF5668 domain-containing protein [Daejeonella sp.]
MKTEKIVWGLILIFTGSIFLLENFDLIEFYWSSVWRFWPVIFILIGANMLLSRFGNKAAVPYMIGAITILTLGLIAYQGTRPDRGRGWLNFKHDNDKEQNAWGASTTFTETYDGSKNARLNIQGGATSFRLTDTTSNLFEASLKRQFGRFTLNKTVIDSTEVLNFRMRNGKQSWNLDKMENNRTLIQMNNTPVWDIKIEMGAGEAIFDLSDYKVKKLVFEGGAASFEAKLGSGLPLTEVAVETGVANVEIEVPDSSGCRIVVDSGLSSKDFIGFIKQSDGTYETSNYGTAANKINISLKGGLSSFEVKKY